MESDNEYIQRKACPSPYIAKNAAAERQTRTHAVYWFFLWKKDGKCHILSNGKAPQSTAGSRGLIFHLTGLVEAGGLTSAAIPFLLLQRRKGVVLSNLLQFGGNYIGKFPIIFPEAL